MTLMELLVVVTIVGILASIAYPAYTQFVRQTNRTDATKTMQLAAQSLERCYSVNFTYINAATTPCNIIAGNTNSPQGFYTITVAIADPQTYLLTATPLTPPQTADNSCLQFTLSSTGQQAAQDLNANDTTQLCWGSN